MPTLNYADLKKFLKKNAEGNTVGVADAKLGSIIKEKLGIPCIFRCAQLLDYSLSLYLPLTQQ